MKRNFREIESRESERTEIAREADSHTIAFLLRTRKKKKQDMPSWFVNSIDEWKSPRGLFQVAFGRA